MFIAVSHVALRKGERCGLCDNKRWSEITRASGMGMSYFTWSALEPWVEEVASALFEEQARLPWRG